RMGSKAQMSFFPKTKSRLCAQKKHLFQRGHQLACVKASQKTAVGILTSIVPCTGAISVEASRVRFFARSFGSASLLLSSTMAGVSSGISRSLLGVQIN